MKEYKITYQLLIYVSESIEFILRYLYLELVSSLLLMAVHKKNAIKNLIFAAYYLIELLLIKMRLVT